MTDALQALLDAPSAALPAATPSLWRRLAAAIRGLAVGAAGQGDVAALLRQAMDAEQLRAGRQSLWAPSAVTGPSRPPWPDFATWDEYGISASPAGPGRVTLRRRPWSPAWLDRGALAAIDDATVGEQRRFDRSVDADPLLSATL